MLKFLKILLLISLWVTLGAVIWYRTHEDFLIAKVRSYFETELSASLNQSIKIKTIEFKHLNTLVLKDIAVYTSEDKSNAAMKIKLVTVTADLLPMIIERKFGAKISIGGLVTEKMSLDTVVKIRSRAARSWKGIFDSSLLEKAVITRGSLKWTEYEADRIHGVLRIKDLAIAGGKISLSCKGMDLFIDFTREALNNNIYHSTVTSKNFTLEASLSQAENILTVSSFRGILFLFAMDLHGKILKIDSDNKTFELGGKVSGNIEKLSQFFPMPDIRGPFSANFTASFEEHNELNGALEAEVRSKHVKYGALEAGDFVADLSVKNKEILAKNISFTLFESPTTGSFGIDLNDANLPLSFSVKTNGMDTNTLLKNLFDHKDINCGALGLDLSFKGYGRDAALLWGALKRKPGQTSAEDKETARKAALRSELSASIELESLALENFSLENIASKISIKDGSLDISSLDLDVWGGDFHGTYRMDLRDEKLPIALTAQINSADSEAGAIGKIFSPKGKPEGKLSLSLAFNGHNDDLSSLWKTLELLGAKNTPESRDTLRRKMAGDIEFDAQVKLDTVVIEKTRVENISSELSVKNGVFNISSLDFRAFGGFFHGSSEMKISDKKMPLALNAKIKGMDSKAAYETISAEESKMSGPLDFTFSFKGYGSDLASISDILKNLSARPSAEARNIVEKRVAELVDETRGVRLELDTSLKLEKLDIEKTTLKNISTTVSVKNDLFNISSLDFASFGGVFSGRMSMNLAKKRLPTTLHAEISKMDFSPGCLDLALSFQGYYKDLSDAAENIRKRSKGVKLPAAGTVRQTVLLLAEEKRLRGASLNADVNMKNFVCDRKPIGPASGKVTLEDGVLALSSFSYGTSGGKLLGSAKLDLNKDSFPLTLNAKLDEIDLENTGTVSGNVSYAGTLRYLNGVAGRVKEEVKKTQKPMIEKIRNCIAALSGEPNVMGQNLNASLLFKTFKIGRVQFNELSIPIILKDAQFTVSPIFGSFYGGAFSAGFGVSLGDTYAPFAFSAQASGADYGEFMRELTENKSKVSGKLETSFGVKGNLMDEWSYTGSGQINISDAKLGTMPVLTPLLGSLYSVMENMFPAFEKVEITSAKADFDIKARELHVKDLELFGRDMDIVAEGKMDFDGKLNIAFENRLIAPETDEEESWAVSIRNFIASFGKTMSKAYLRGTVKEPKWEFEYVSQVKKGINKNVDTFMQNVGK